MVLPKTHEILIADIGVSDLNVLIDGLDPAIETWICDGDEGDDPLSMLREALTTDGVSRIHLLGPGDPGRLSIGDALIDTQTVREYFLELSEAPGARQCEIAVWGSNVALGTSGSTFIRTLAECTGAVVAASSKPLGTVDGNGRWTLDVIVRPRVPFKRAQLAAFAGSLSLGRYPEKLSDSPNEELAEIDAFPV
jgi:hypothetical protein